MPECDVIVVAKTNLEHREKEPGKRDHVKRNSWWEEITQFFGIRPNNYAGLLTNEEI